MTPESNQTVIIIMVLGNRGGNTTALLSRALIAAAGGGAAIIAQEEGRPEFAVPTIEVAPLLRLASEAHDAAGMVAPLKAKREAQLLLMRAATERNSAQLKRQTSFPRPRPQRQHKRP